MRKWMTFATEEKRTKVLRQAKELDGYRLGAREGEIGQVREFYFEDVNWTV
jgi:hypothetical protein